MGQGSEGGASAVIGDSERRGLFPPPNRRDKPGGSLV
jgi:hypothetical protein